MRIYSDLIRPPKADFHQLKQKEKHRWPQHQRPREQTMQYLWKTNKNATVQKAKMITLLDDRREQHERSLKMRWLKWVRDPNGPNGTSAKLCKTYDQQSRGKCSGRYGDYTSGYGARQLKECEMYSRRLDCRRA